MHVLILFSQCPIKKNIKNSKFKFINRSLNKIYQIKLINLDKKKTINLLIIGLKSLIKNKIFSMIKYTIWSIFNHK